MQGGIFEEREHAVEAAYFRQQDARLLETLRDNASIDDIAAAMAGQLAVDNVDLLVRIRGLGITADTATALFLAPLIQVGWADGSVNRKVRKAVLASARERGIAAGSPAEALLLQWLAVRPSDAVFATALEMMAYGLAVLTPGEKEARIDRIVEACREVAVASGSKLAKMLGLTSAVSRAEASTLAAIRTALRTPPPKAHSSD